VIDFSDTESQIPSQSGHSSGGEDHSSASPTTPRANVSTSAMRQQARALNLGPNPISHGNGNGYENGHGHVYGNGNGNGNGEGLPASPHPLEGIAK
jgi:hypothetical protein